MPQLVQKQFPSHSREKVGGSWTEDSISPQPNIPNGRAWPKISIVTPSFNQGQFIEETIRSVLFQNYPNLEYIIIDGGSTDNSVEIIKKHQSSLSYWVSEQDRGQAHALNKGFARATGQIFGYLNSDDLLTEGTLTKVAEVFQGSLDQALTVSFAGVEFGESQEELHRAPEVNPQLDDWLSSPVSLFQPSTFWTRVLNDSLGGFREEFCFCLDKEFFLRAIFQSGSYKAVPEWVGSRLRLHHESKTTLLSESMWAENRALFKAYKHNRRCSVARLAATLAKEKLALNARRKTQCALDKTATFERVGLLLRAAVISRREMRSRFYLGAWKRVIRESIKVPARNGSQRRIS